MWLEHHLEGSKEYATRISKNLKELIFENIFEQLATGFIECRRIDLGIEQEDEHSLKEVFTACLAILYRLLFLLYAESRGLLPVDDNPRYYKKSLMNLKWDIAHEIKTSADAISINSYEYWHRLESLCRIIDKGDKALNIPTYNGGLFNTPPSSFLCTNKISDKFLAVAINNLTVDIEKSQDTIRFIDYTALDVRHLGDIYEGLLEFHINIATENIVEIKEKGKFVWKKRAEIDSKTKVRGQKKKGEVYIKNSKGERRISGSYYTPHYIVEYIVDHTVKTVFVQRIQKAEQLFEEIAVLDTNENALEIENKESEIFGILFGIKVLDPAMGSGHFLVHAVDYIAGKISTFLSNYPSNSIIDKIIKMRDEILNDLIKQNVSVDVDKLTEINLIKRMVMKRCIYGVDLNHMAVELTKLSLWLDSFTLGAPLSFLDHHLKCGNSLISTTIGKLEKAMSEELFSINLGPLNRAIQDMGSISDLPDATVAQVKESSKKYGDANKGIEGYRVLLDMLIAEQFGIPEAKDILIYDADKIDLNKLQQSLILLPEKEQDVINQTKAISNERRFFNWEIEFSEAFYEQTDGQKVQKRNNPGFDCVIGNPPYVRQEELGSFKKDYLKPNYKSFHNKADLYTYFFETGLEHLKNDGRLGMITSNKFMKTEYGMPLRKYLGHSVGLNEIVDFGELPVFEDAATFPAIFIIDRTKVTSYVQYAPIRTLAFETLESEVQKSARKIDASIFEGEQWSFAGDYGDAIFAKMDSVSIPLGKYCSGNIRYGIKTGLNNAFIIDKITTDGLVKNGNKGSQFIKPLIVGDDVRKYEINYRDTYLIVIPSGSTKKTILSEAMEKHGFMVIDNEILNDLQKNIADEYKWKKKCAEYEIECGSKKIWQGIFDDFKEGIDNAFEWFTAHYPTIASYLKQFEELASKRADQGDFWWELRPCDYYSFFDGTKIVYPEIAMESRFAFDDTGAYPLKTLFTIPMDDKYLLSVLNSQAVFEYLRNTCSVLGDVDKKGRLMFQLIYLEKIPIPSISFTTPADSAEIEQLNRANRTPA